jgi:hypothetical protein
MDYSKFNKEKKFIKEFDTEAVYIKLEEYYKLYESKQLDSCIVTHMYTSNKGLYGEKAVVSVKGYHVNLPSHQTNIVKELLNIRECVNDINNGKLAMIPYTYQMDGNTYYSVNWIESELVDR